jgi:hypothetical protein
MQLSLLPNTTVPATLLQKPSRSVVNVFLGA